MKFLFKLPTEHKIIMALCCIVLFVAIFHNNMSIGASAHVGSIKGSIELEAFENIEKANNTACVCLFYAPWCGHCKKLMPIWDKFSQKNANRTDIIVTKIDCEKHKEIGEQHEIKGYPTIKYYPFGLNNKENSREYSGDRDENSLQDFLNKLSQH